MILVSGCLIGKNCKYNGGNNRNADVIAYLKNREYMVICPEVMGGLGIPHPPAEILGDRVIDCHGNDVTSAFQKGAECVLQIAIKQNADLCILKESSPSCGVHTVYDGTFSKRKVDGMGITAKRLYQEGFLIISEKDLKNN